MQKSKKEKKSLRSRGLNLGKKLKNEYILAISKDQINQFIQIYHYLFTRTVDKSRSIAAVNEIHQITQCQLLL